MALPITYILTSLNNKHDLSTIHNMGGVIQACSGVNNMLNSTVSPTDKYVDGILY